MRALLAFILILLGAEFASPSYAESDYTNSENINNELLEKAQNYKNRVTSNTKSLSLKDCIQEAVRNNPDIISNYNLIQSLEWSVVAARRTWYPTFNLNSIAYSNNFNDEYLAAQSTTTSTISTNPSLNVTWTFFQPTLPPAIDSEISLLKAQRFTYDYTLRTLVLDVQTSYVNLQAGLALIDAYKQIYKSNRQQVAYLTAQVDSGLATVGDLAQSETTMYQQLGDLVTYQENFLTEAANMAKLIGLKDDTLVSPVSKFTKQGNWPLTLSKSIDNALDAREEIKQYLQTSASNSWNARSLVNKYLPSLYLTLSSSYLRQSGCSSIDWGAGCFGDNKLTSSKVDGQIYLGMNWQFDGGVSAANANVSKAQAKSNLALADNERTIVTNQVKSSYNQYLSSEIANELARKQLEQARLNLDVSRERLLVGIGDITTVVQAQQLLASAVLAQVSAVQQYNIAIAQLYRYAAIVPPSISSEVLVSE